ncbi:amidase [Ramlibacter alkalitolerans]|uniref:Amidase n=1 Tax=Ramlibacter alkalitolerans TaxID=2039631 RepID=A0ABS1JPI7_9BURK|nr:amidase [Ramlibacter alkalitolerans]MBL0426189.1 amidase [Ramlibacter alkalitolerans]
MADDILGLDASTLSRRIAARELSCRALMQASLARIAQLNPRHNAIVSLRPEHELLAEADARDAALARGERAGWMHGFPVAIKDLADVQGLPTTLGSPAVGRRMPAADALFVQRMRQAGAIVIGKTNTPEFGLGSHTYNPVFGITRNAWDAGKSAGGSSGGAAVAIALGMLPVADGSDMGGSLRNPAAFNHILGFRPSRGRVPAVPAEDVFFQQLGTEGPMGRTTEDVARLLCTMAGWDARAPLSLADPLPLPDADDPIACAPGKRIGWLGSIWPDLPLEPGIRELCEQALRKLQSAGCTVEPCTLDIPRETNWTAWLRLRQMLVGGKLGALYAQPQLRERMKPEARWEVEQSFQLTAAQLYQATVQRTAVYQAFRRLFERYDYLAAPSAQVFPFDAELHWPQSVAGVAMDTYHRWMEIVTPFTLASLPVASVPVGFNAAGLPMGLQLAGPARADLQVLALARAFEAIAPWTTQRPPALATLA